MKTPTVARPGSFLCYAQTRLPTRFGSMTVKVYRHEESDEPVALVVGDVAGRQDVPVRIHSACFTSEVLGSLKCDCQQQLDYSVQYIARHGGAVLYLHQEGRGIGLGNKIRAYALQERGHDTVEANHLLGLPVDARTYEVAALILHELGVASIRLLTNNPDKLESMVDLGISVTGRIPVAMSANEHSHSYLATKRTRMGHWMQVSTDLDGSSLMPVLTRSAPTRPFVHINMALRSDGRITAVPGQPNSISCATDWQRVHELREKYAAVAVGANTWRLDKPRLNVRAEHLGRRPMRQPARVIFAGSQQCTVKPDGRRTFSIGGSGNADIDHLITIPCETRDVGAPLVALRDQYQIESLLVEGGTTLLGSFISQEHLDLITIYVRTPDVAQAKRAIRAALGGLPKNPTFECFGEGVLMSSNAPPAI